MLAAGKESGPVWPGVFRVQIVETAGLWSAEQPMNETNSDLISHQHVITVNI